jgi:hypothetical protein
MRATVKVVAIVFVETIFCARVLWYVTRLVLSVRTNGLSRCMESH